MKTVLSIAGTDPTGGAGIQTDLKTFEAFGVYGMAVITVVCAQNTTGVFGSRLTVCLTIFVRMPSRSACCMTQRLFTQ